MLSDHQIHTIGQAWVPLTYLMLVSAAYWFNTKSVAKSAHGVVLILAYVYAVVVSEYTSFGSPGFYHWPLHFLAVTAIVSVIYSLSAFKGEKWVHLVHVGTVVSGFVVWFSGGMEISHDWL